MITIKAKSKKTAFDIFSEISNKISTREALSVVEATRQNVLEAFFLSSNCEKLSLVATKATFSSLAGFSPVKIPLKRHTWVSSSVASIPTKSPKVFNNRPINKLVFPFIASISGVVSTFSSKKIVKKTRNGPRLTTGCVAKCEAKQFPSIGLPETISSHQSFAEWVASTLVPSATFKIKLAYVKAFTSSVYLATLKIAKALVVSESGSPSAAVTLYNVPLGVSVADIKTAVSVFGVVAHVVLKPVGIWQYVVVYFKKLDSAVAVLNHWSVLVDKDSVRILSLAKLVNLFFGCTVFEISNMIFQVGGWTCFIPWSFNSGHYFHFALITFGSQADLDLVVAKTSHLAVDYKVLPSPLLKSPKIFAPYFVGLMSYAKASASLSSFEFSPLSFFAFSPIVVNDSLLSALVEFIVKPVGSMVKLFKQFINEDLVSNSNLSLKVNEVMIYINAFSKVVGKLRRKVVFLKKKCCMEDVNMSGDSELLLVVSDDVFSNLFNNNFKSGNSNRFKNSRVLLRFNIPDGIEAFKKTLYQYIENYINNYLFGDYNISKVRYNLYESLYCEENYPVEQKFFLGFESETEEGKRKRKQKLRTTPNTPKTTAKHLQTPEQGTSFKLPLLITPFLASLAQPQTPSSPLIRFSRIEDFHEETKSEQETENSENKEEMASTYIAKIPEFTGEDIHPHAPEDLATAIQQAKNYEMAMEEANHTKLVNLAIGETSSVAEEKID
ncbi:hypothetical protein G9A89_010830 [Geosiphon pyriformis]|nr:hypothetical protein G9A89_010830 [Geosiphon pyriformis]